MTPIQHHVQEAGDGLLGRALGGSNPLRLGGQQRPHQRDERCRGRGGPGPQAQPADRITSHSELQVFHPRAAVEQQALFGWRRGVDGKRRAAGVEQGEARVECPSSRAHDLGQPGAGLDGGGDGLDRAQLVGNRRVRGRRRDMEAPHGR